MTGEGAKRGEVSIRGAKDAEDARENLIRVAKDAEGAEEMLNYYGTPGKCLMRGAISRRLFFDFLFRGLRDS